MTGQINTTTTGTINKQQKVQMGCNIMRTVTEPQNKGKNNTKQ